MMNKKDTLVAIIFFLLGMTLMYFYSQRATNAAKQFNDKLGANCGAAMTAASQLVKNCNQSKAEVVSCYSDLELCDQKEFNKRMEILSEDAKKLDNNLWNYTKEMEGLLNAYKE